MARFEDFQLSPQECVLVADGDPGGKRFREPGVQVGRDSQFRDALSARGPWIGDEEQQCLFANLGLGGQAGRDALGETLGVRSVRQLPVGAVNPVDRAVVAGEGAAAAA
jgi:hypothetical protein